MAPSKHCHYREGGHCLFKSPAPSSSTRWQPPTSSARRKISQGEPTQQRREQEKVAGRRKLAPREEVRESDTSPGFNHHSKSLLSLRRPGSQAPTPSPLSSGARAGASLAARRGGLPTSTLPAPARQGRSRLKNRVISALGEGAAASRGCWRESLLMGSLQLLFYSHHP